MEHEWIDLARFGNNHNHVITLSCVTFIIVTVIGHRRQHTYIWGLHSGRNPMAELSEGLVLLKLEKQIRLIEVT